jgi:predicted dehydrogenase
VGEPLSVGMVGAGAISGQYLATLEKTPSLRLTAVADLDPARAAAVANARPGVRPLGVDALVADADVALVLNLTVPAAHADVALRAIAAGKDVYGEKPLAATIDEAHEVLRAADTAGVRVGCAPDTVLGTGIQTARTAIDDGLIGSPIAATAIMATPGHERWHPNPDFYYLPGGGPLLDMGPYYVTALVNLLGPVTRVTGAASQLRAERTIGSGARAGETIGVGVDTHVSGILTHRSGALSTLIMSFDTVATRAPSIEVHGERGSLVVPDPNRFTGDTSVRLLGETSWQTLPVSAGYIDGSRGCGIADLHHTPSSRRPRTDGAIAFHVLDIMESLLTSAAQGRSVDITSTCVRPPAVPLGQVDDVSEAPRMTGHSERPFIFGSEGGSALPSKRR